MDNEQLHYWEVMLFAKKNFLQKLNGILSYANSAESKQDICDKIKKAVDEMEQDVRGTEATFQDLKGQ